MICDGYYIQTFYNMNKTKYFFLSVTPVFTKFIYKLYQWQWYIILRIQKGKTDLFWFIRPINMMNNINRYKLHSDSIDIM